MAPQVVWTKRASDDLYQVFDTLSSYSNIRAETVVEAIIDQAFHLEQFPRMGRVVPEVNIDSIREIIVHQYRVIYLVNAQGVEILAVRHSSKPLSSL